MKQFDDFVFGKGKKQDPRQGSEQDRNKGQGQKKAEHGIIPWSKAFAGDVARIPSQYEHLGEIFQVSFFHFETHMEIRVPTPGSGRAGPGLAIANRETARSSKSRPL